MKIVAAAVVAEDNVPVIGNDLSITKHGVFERVGNENAGVLIVLGINAIHEDTAFAGLTGMPDEREHGSGGDAEQ